MYNYKNLRHHWVTLCNIQINVNLVSDKLLRLYLKKLDIQFF